MIATNARPFSENPISHSGFTPLGKRAHLSCHSVLSAQYTSPICPSVKLVRPARRNPVRRIALTGLGLVLVVAAPLVGVIPGPGGIPVFAAGLALMLRNSERAKRVFVRAKRRWPRLGYYADIGLRRGSAKRRRALAKAARTAPPAPCPPAA